MTFSGKDLPAPPIQQAHGAGITTAGVPGRVADTGRSWEDWNNLLRDRYNVYPLNRQRLGACRNKSDIPRKSYRKTSGSFSSGINLDQLGMPENEAVEMDPGQGFALKLAWNTIEYSGILPDGIKGSTGGWIACGQDSGWRCNSCGDIYEQ